MQMKYIIFDLDGTLIDSMPVWKNIGGHYLESHGFAVPADLHNIIKTQTLYQTAEYFQNVLGVPHEPQEIVDEVISYVADAYRHAIPLKPFVREYLEKQSRAGVKMCILTASEATYIRPALQRLDIEKYFTDILTCTELGVYKEDGKAFLTAMEKMGGTPQDTVVFEDAYYAVKGAKAVGLTVYAVIDDEVRSTEDLQKIQVLADRCIVDYGELL